MTEQHHTLKTIIALAVLTKEQGTLVAVLGVVQALLLDLHDLHDPRVEALLEKHEVEFIEPT